MASIEQTIAGFADLQPATADQLLPLLHVVQQAHGYIPVAAIGLIAQTLNLSRAEVFGVVSFYDDLCTEPRGTVIEICGAEACQALGCRSLLADVRAKLDVDVEIREVFCLGNCVAGPSARVGNKILGRVTSARLQRAVAALESHE